MSITKEDNSEAVTRLEENGDSLECTRELMKAEENKDLYGKFINIPKRNLAFTEASSDEDRLAMENRLALSNLQEQCKSRIRRIQYLCALLA